MSICPTCGHWTAEPVPDGLEDTIKPCRTCASRQRSGDAELLESCGKYHVRCYGCHLSTGDYNDPREAVEEWNALWEGVEEADKLKGLLRRTVPCIEYTIGHLRNERATSLVDSKTMMVYTAAIEKHRELLEEVRAALGEEAGNGKEPPTCDDCEYCYGMRDKIIDYDTGETMPWGQCRVHVFCYGDVCNMFKPKQEGGQP